MRVDDRATDAYLAQRLEQTVDIGGFRFAERKKWRDVLANPYAAFVVDDQISVGPWVVHMLEIPGLAETITSGGSTFDLGFAEEFIRIHPERINSFGPDGDQSITSR